MHVYRVEGFLGKLNLTHLETRAVVCLISLMMLVSLISSYMVFWTTTTITTMQSSSSMSEGGRYSVQRRQLDTQLSQLVNKSNATHRERESDRSRILARRSIKYHNQEN